MTEPEYLNGSENQNQESSGCFWGFVVAGAISGLAFILLVFVIVIPYLIYSHPHRNSQAEAKVNMGAIFTCQVAYYGEHNTYAGGKQCFDLIGWSPEGDTLYNYYCGDDVIPCNKKGCDRCLKTKLPNPAPTSSAEAFTVYAIGNIDGDTHCDVWSTRDSKELRNDYNDVGD
jgi:hypothetical protein